jgi:hypothetical protein
MYFLCKGLGKSCGTSRQLIEGGSVGPVCYFTVFFQSPAPSLKHCQSVSQITWVCDLLRQASILLCKTSETMSSACEARSFPAKALVQGTCCSRCATISVFTERQVYASVAAQSRWMGAPLGALG